MISIAAGQSNLTSIVRRNLLNLSAIKMVQLNPVFGVGLNAFTTQVERYSQSTEIVKFIQPTHHVGLLWISETGIVGVLILMLLRKRLDLKRIASKLLVLSPILALDHYLLTNQVGLLLLSIFLIL